jgi:uncharacterized protein YbaP (TraB family)
MPRLPSVWLYTLVLALFVGGPDALARDCPERPEPPTAEVPATRLGQGLLWRIEGGPPGERAPSHLYGTMHVDFPEVTRLPPPVALAFAKARGLVVEVPLDQTSQAVYRSHMQLPEGEPGLIERLGGPLAGRYLVLARDLGVLGSHADRLTPWAAANLVGRPPPRAGGITLDERLQLEAQATGRPVRALETMSGLIAALARVSPEDHLALLVDAICQADTMARELEVDLGHYLRGDLDALMARAREPIPHEPAFARHWAVLVEGRNESFMQELLPLLAEGGQFVAVGALHLPGEGGLLARIEAAGYRLVRVYGGRSEEGATEDITRGGGAQLQDVSPR